MGTILPAVGREIFEEKLHRLSRAFDADLGALSIEALWLHYCELLRWNPRLSLIGPGTGEEVLERHYGEALAALPSLPANGSILDVGSGGGFPGFVLAAARPELHIALLEPKARKWSFLQTVIRKVKAAGIPLSCRALDARVENPLPATPALPEKIDIITCRALALGPSRTEALIQKYPGVRFLLWSSGPRESDQPSIDAQEQTPETDSPSSEAPNLGQEMVTLGDSTSYRVASRIHLLGSRHRFIVDLTPL